MKLFNRFYNHLMVNAVKKAPKIRDYKKILTADVNQTGVIKQGVTMLCPLSY